MAFLKLSDIGKIYVNEGNVSVGIRGVNLEFEKGEFVAVTGESGSGKSTLLNIISGMDTYEEGEMFVEGEPTSHFIQSDFEEYRKNYISFIFQDYNIIDSYTVLENVELALMHIENRGERRKKALELINRVGLTKWLRHKGSKLSGGQKQRTVIARALAKDSPIILADEPTGNLDAATSREIIDLLKEVSKDKLLIVVTHNFDEVEKHATRHVRIYNGEVYFDKKITDANVSQDIEKVDQKNKNEEKIVKKISSDIKNGFILGSALFKAKPILTIFTVFLLLIGTLSMLFVTSSCFNSEDMYVNKNIFTPTRGRLIFMSREGDPLTDETVEETALKYGAKDWLFYDKILDRSYNVYYKNIGKAITFDFEYYGSKHTPDIGRIPVEKNEIAISVPVSLKPYYGNGEDGIILNDTFDINGFPFKITGISYFYDNTKNSKIHSTKDGLDFLSVIISANMSNSYLYLTSNDAGIQENYIVEYDPSLEGDKILIPKDSIFAGIKDFSKITAKIIVFTESYNTYEPYNEIYDIKGHFAGTGQAEFNVSVENISTHSGYEDYSAKIGPEVFFNIINSIHDESKSKYTQASLFFTNDKEASAAAIKMNDGDFIAVLSNTEFEPDIYSVITATVVIIFMGIFWLATTLFLSFFISLCLARTVNSFKADLSIMRSMGIPVRVIKWGVFFKMLLSLLIAYALVLVCAVFIFTYPKTNAMIGFLQPLHYLIILAGVAIITVKVTKSQIKRLFNESVKKSLRKGNEQ